MQCSQLSLLTKLNNNVKSNVMSEYALKYPILMVHNVKDKIKYLSYVFNYSSLMVHNVKDGRD